MIHLTQITSLTKIRKEIAILLHTLISLFCLCLLTIISFRRVTIPQRISVFIVEIKRNQLINGIEFSFFQNRENLLLENEVQTPQKYYKKDSKLTKKFKIYIIILKKKKKLLYDIYFFKKKN